MYSSKWLWSNQLWEGRFWHVKRTAQQGFSGLEHRGHSPRRKDREGSICGEDSALTVNREYTLETMDWGWMNVPPDYSWALKHSDSKCDFKAPITTHISFPQYSYIYLIFTFPCLSTWTLLHHTRKTTPTVWPPGWLREKPPWFFPCVPSTRNQEAVIWPLADNWNLPRGKITTPNLSMMQRYTQRSGCRRQIRVKVSDSQRQREKWGSWRWKQAWDVRNELFSLGRNELYQ